MLKELFIAHCIVCGLGVSTENSRSAEQRGVAHAADFLLKGARHQVEIYTMEAPESKMLIGRKV